MDDGKIDPSIESSTESDGDQENISDRINLASVNKKRKPGIVYLSSVPSGMNVSQTTAFFSEFGRQVGQILAFLYEYFLFNRVGRIFLQPDKMDKKTGKYNRVFSEGWVEFMSKKVAKSVAESLNSVQVGGKRRSKAHDELWNLKYLPRFKWVHLSERLAYESAVRQQRMRTEISQVKREAEHFKNSVERKKKKSKKEKAGKEEGSVGVPFQFKQRETEHQIKKRKREENVFTVTDLEVSPAKKKKTKKSKDKSEESSKVPVKIKSKKSKRGREEKSGSRKPVEGDRSEFLKSVFGGGT